MKRPLGRLRDALAARHAEVLLWTAAVVLRLFLLNAKSLWLDESMTLMIARAPLAAVVPLVRANELLPPLHYLLMHAWTACFADPLAGLRIFSVLCGLAALAVFHRACRLLIPRQALLAFAVAVFSSYWIDVSQSGRPYSLFLLLSAVEFELFLRLRGRWTARAGLAYAAVGVLGLYTHYFFGFFLLAQLLDAAHLRRRDLKALVPWLGCAAFWAAAFAPWLPGLREQLAIYAGKPTLNEPFGLAALTRLFGGLFVNVSLLSFVIGGWISAAGATVLAFFAAGPFLKRRLDPDEKKAAALLAVQLAVPLAAAKAVELALGRPATQARYFVFLSIPAYALAAFLIGRLDRGARRAASAALALALAAGVAGYDYSALELDARLPALSAALRRAARPGDVIVHLDPFYYTSLRYYYLPELPNFILDGSSPMLNWKGLPGVGAVLPPRDLARLARVLIVDPDRTLFAHRIGTASGAQLDAWRNGGAAPAAASP
jgi:mannosyltransferase